MFTLQSGAQHGIAEPIAFSQNQREEVRDLGNLAAAVKSPGTHEATFLAEPLGFDRAQITSDKNYSNPKPGDPQPPLNTAGQGMVAGVFSPVDYAAGRYEERPVTASRDPSRATPLAVDGEPFALSIRGREGGAAAEVEKDGIAPVLRNSSGGGGQHTFVAAPTMSLKTDATLKTGGDLAHTMTQPSPSGGGQPPAVMHAMRVRRLTPGECEALQGFPQGWTKIPWKGKDPELCPDGPRYRALGNSMAVPCMSWIGRRIQAVEEIS